MKKIKLRRDVLVGPERLSSVLVFRQVLSSSPTRALNVDEIRRRVHVLDALDQSGAQDEWLVLEDEDAKILAGAVEGYPWASANKGLLSIIDDALKPETAPKLAAVEKTAS